MKRIIAFIGRPRFSASQMLTNALAIGLMTADRPWAAGIALLLGTVVSAVFEVAYRQQAQPEGGK